MSMNYITYALIVVVFFTIYMAVAHMFKRDKFKTRLQATGEFSDDIAVTPPFAEFCQAILPLLGVNAQAQKSIAVMLNQAGIQSPYAVFYYLFVKRIIQPIILVLAGLYLVYALSSSSFQGGDKYQAMFIFLLLVTLGVSGTTFYVDYRKRQYRERLYYSIPEVMDLLLICIESGLALDAALSRVTNEMKHSHPEIVRELERTKLELSVMSDRVQALQNLADRTNIMPLRSLVAALVQSEKFGTSLVDTLRVLAEDQREARIMALEQKAARIPVLITLPLVTCILPALFIVILGPPMLGIIHMGGFQGMLNGGHP